MRVQVAMTPTTDFSVREGVFRQGIELVPARASLIAGVPNLTLDSLILFSRTLGDVAAHPDHGEVLAYFLFLERLPLTVSVPNVVYRLEFQSHTVSAGRHEIMAASVPSTAAYWAVGPAFSEMVRNCSLQSRTEGPMRHGWQNHHATPCSQRSGGGCSEACRRLRLPSAQVAKHGESHGAGP